MSHQDAFRDGWQQGWRAAMNRISAAVLMAQPGDQPDDPKASPATWYAKRRAAVAGFIADPKRGDEPSQLDELERRLRVLEQTVADSSTSDRLRALEEDQCTLMQEFADHKRAWFPEVHRREGVGEPVLVNDLVAETFLERVQKERELVQKAELKAQLSEHDAAELARYRNHTPSGRPRYGTPEYEAQTQEQKDAPNPHYKPGFVDT